MQAGQTSQHDAANSQLAQVVSHFIQGFIPAVARGKLVGFISARQIGSPPGAGVGRGLPDASGRARGSAAGSARAAADALRGLRSEAPLVSRHRDVSHYAADYERFRSVSH